jgi:hypothetical protein
LQKKAGCRHTEGSAEHLFIGIIANRKRQMQYRLYYFPIRPTAPKEAAGLDCLPGRHSKIQNMRK